MLKKVQLRAPEGAEYSILFAGDFCPREENGPYVAENAEKIVAGIKSIFDDADLRILQWETTLTTGGTPIIKDGPNLRAVPECLNFILSAKTTFTHTFWASMVILLSFLGHLRMFQT